MENHIDFIPKLLAERALLLICMAALVDLLRVAEEPADQQTNRHDDDRDQDDVILDPFLAVCRVGFRVVDRVIGVLEVLHRLHVLAVTVKALADADIGAVVVVVALKDGGVIVDRRVVVLVLGVLKRVCNQIAVGGAFVDRDGVVGGVEQQNVRALIRDGLQILNVADLIADIAEHEQQHTVGVVGEHLRALLVNDAPHPVRTERHVHNLRGAGDGDVLIAGTVVNVHLAGGREEAVAVHNVGAARVELLDRRVGVRLALGLDGSLLLRRVDGRRGHIEEAVRVDGEVVVLGRDILNIGLFLLRRLEHTPEIVPCVDGNLLRADEAVEGTVTVERNDAVVRRRGDDVDTAGRVGRDRNRRVNACLGEHVARRLVNDDLEIADLIENDDSRFSGVGDKDFRVRDEHALRLGERIGYALIVHKLVDDEAQVIVFIQTDDAARTGRRGRAGIDDINMAEVVNADVVNRLQICCGTYACGLFC